MKKEIVISIVSAFFLFLLRYFNIFGQGNGFENPLIFFFFVLVLSGFIIIVERGIRTNHQEEKVCYENLDLMRYLLSIVVIILHLRPFFLSSSQLDLAFNNIISRICVPFFFVVTGYFVGKKDKDHPGYIKEYRKRNIPVYLLWSALYIPVLILSFFQNLPVISTYITSLNIPFPLLLCLGLLLLPVALVIALCYTGIYYHLWYFPALLLSLWVLERFKKKFNIKYLLAISFVLLLFGATETYYGFFPVNMQQLLDYYYRIFFTTRNFLVFGLFYVVFGYYIGQKKDSYTEYCFLKFIACLFLLIIEGLLLQTTTRLNSNILLSSVPLVYYLFLSLLYSKPLLKHISTKKLRVLSKYYYLTHPFIIFLLAPVLGPSDSMKETIFVIGLILFMTHFLSNGIVKLRTRFPKTKI